MIKCQITWEKSCDSLEEEQFMVRFYYLNLDSLFEFFFIYEFMFSCFWSTAADSYCVENSWFSVWTEPEKLFWCLFHFLTGTGWRKVWKSGWASSEPTRFRRPFSIHFDEDTQCTSERDSAARHFELKHYVSVNWVKKTIQTECPKTSKSPCFSIETMMLSVGPLNFEVHIYYTYIKREKRNGIYILWISLLHVIIKEERESFI